MLRRRCARRYDHRWRVCSLGIRKHGKGSPHRLRGARAKCIGPLGKSYRAVVRKRRALVLGWRRCSA